MIRSKFTRALALTAILAGCATHQPVVGGDVPPPEDRQSGSSAGSTAAAVVCIIIFPCAIAVAIGAASAVGDSMGGTDFQ